MAQIDAAITDKTTSASISPADVGDNMKDVVGYVDQEVAAITAADVGLGNVNNTSDANKPVSTAQAAAIALATRPYKVYSAILNQAGTAAPTTTVLENTLTGTPVFTRFAAGAYFMTLNAAFVVNKCWQLVNQSDPTVFISVQRQSANVYAINATQGGVSSDDIIQSAALEIRVYN